AGLDEALPVAAYWALKAAVERDAASTPAFAHTHALLAQWSRTQDWRLAALLAQSLAAPTARGDAGAIGFLYRCVEPGRGFSRERAAAAAAAAAALQAVPPQERGSATDKLLALLTGLPRAVNPEGGQGDLFPQVIKAACETVGAYAERETGQILGAARL